MNEPVKLQERFNRIVAQHDWWQAGQPIVVAVSTGVDSMVLLALLEHLPQRRPQVIVAYVDHCLRHQSRQETIFLENYCRAHHLKLAKKSWQPKDHPRHGIEAAARHFRYQFFREVLKANQSTVLLTAHHGDDLAETMLMKLVRGGQLDSLIGIDEVRQTSFGQLIRPLLTFSKNDLRQFASTNQLRWFEDETNQDLAIQRNRFRHQILPKLKAENPKMLDHFINYSQQLKSMITVNHELLAPLADKVVISFTVDQRLVADLSTLIGYSNQVQLNLIRYLLEHWLKIDNIGLNQLAQLQHLLANAQKPQGKLNFPNHWQVIKRYQQLIIEKKVDKPIIKSKIGSRFMVILDRWYSLSNGSKFGVFTSKVAADHYQVTPLILLEQQFPLSVRYWHPGDRLRLKNGGHQKVNRLMINAKLPSEQRLKTQLLVTDDDDILAVLGLKSAFFPTKQGKRVYLVEQRTQSTSERKGINNE